MEDCSSKIPPVESASLVLSNGEELNCPFLLNVFYRFNRHNKMHFYQQFFLHTNKSYYNGGTAAGSSSSSSSTDAFHGQQMMHIYTWLDISLRELFDLVSGAAVGLSDSSSTRTSRDFVLDFCSVGLDRNGNYCMRQVGAVFLDHPPLYDNVFTAIIYHLHTERCH